MIWNRLYSTSSSCDKGTLYQLRNLIHRSAVGTDPSKNMKAFEDFLLVVLSSYLLTAAENTNHHNHNCIEVSKMVVSRWVKINILQQQEEAGDTTPSTRTTSAPSNRTTSAPSTRTTLAPSTRTICTTTEVTASEYITELITLGLLWHGFHDAIKEGDGDRIFLYWKFLLPVFKEENHHNYAKEAFNLTFQSKVLSPRKLCELKWNRTVNTHGKAGHNVPCDLHMEHLNRRLKKCIRSSGSNVYPSAIQRAARSLGPVNHVCSEFEAALSLYENKDYHTYIPKF